MEGRNYRYRSDEQAYLEKVMQPNAFEEYYGDFPEQAVPIVQIRAQDQGVDRSESQGQEQQ